MAAGSSRPAAERVLDGLSAFRRRSEQLTAAVPASVWLGLLGALFVVAAWIAVVRLDLSWRAVGWLPLVLATVVGVPLTAAANALEYRLSARVGGHRAGLLESARVSITATAANMLPLPGGVLVRLGALQRAGVRPRSALGATGAVGLAWLGVALVTAGVILAAGARPLGGAAATSAGVVLLGMAWRLLAWLCRPASPPLGRLLAIEILSVGATALRLALLLAAVGVGWRPLDAAVLAVSGVIATSVGMIPAGVGLKEALTAALAVVVGIAASVGLLVSVLDRVVGLAGHAALSFLVVHEAPGRTLDRRSPAER